MNSRATFALIAAALLLPAAAPAAKEPDDRPKLAVVVVENLRHSGNAIDDFVRLDMALQKVSKERKWPVAIEAERFAANTPDHETEVRIFPRPVRQELPDEYVFRGWLTLKVAGENHDFGIIKFEYRPRPGEWGDDVLDKIFLGAARAMADKIEPLLFPREERPAGS
ncbi:MAG TPA: hypothetical protein VMM36_01425 [Opitutaceae bacterium]|nr:hypothetical protein [Opitutaceae bacterium]